MRNKILEIIKEKPKHYSLFIKKDDELSKWVQENTLSDSMHYPEIIYSALHNESNVCEFGNKKSVNRLSEGWIGCGPANKCKCTANSIARNVAKTKSLTTAEENLAINIKRENTMIAKFGVPFSSQRPEVKTILSKSKLTLENEILLNDKIWMQKEYIDKQKSLTEIAQDLNVYYSTVGEYCKKHGFTIRQRTNYSIQEKEICNFLDTINIQYTHSDWTILGSKEIDVYIPSHKFGIELNGLYWHSHNPYCTHTPSIENKNKHKDKADLAKLNNVDLIQITDFEWINKPDIIKSIIKTKLGMASKMYARKFTIRDVLKNEEKEFLNKNHLQGYISSTSAIGLYLENELYMLMSIGKSRFSNNADIELLRLCTKINYIVIGGTQRLFNQISKLYKNKTIVSYCDMSKFNGNSYKNLGFELTKDITPGYFWTDGNYPISRFKCQKSQLSKWLPTFDSTKSESENMFLAKYRRYWDCGQSVWARQL